MVAYTSAPKVVARTIVGMALLVEGASITSHTVFDDFRHAGNEAPNGCGGTIFAAFYPLPWNIKKLRFSLI
jgi:hypothetical protein